MDTRGQDTLTQIQKYKAMLSSKRNKGEDKAIRKPKKKRLQKEHVETGLETVLGLVAVPAEKQQNPNELWRENVKQENVDSANLQASTVLSEKKPSIAQEGEDEEKLKETFSWKESILEQGENSAVLMSPEAKEEESGVEVNSEQDVEEKEANNKENKPKEGAEGKEKISRAEKFKRWASFTKQKKTGDAVVIEKESYDSKISKSTSQAIQIPVVDKATEGDLKDGNLTDVEKVDTEVLESSPLPEKQRRRSLSLSEATDKEKETLSTDNDQSGVETASSQVDKIADLNVETSSWKEQNKESVNEAESKQALEQKTDKSIVEDGEQSFEVTGDYSAEVDEQESPKKDQQPKRKKRSFLRKISIKNLKANKKDEESTTGKSRKLEISEPMLIKSENQVEKSYFKTVGEVSPEKPYKRKKSGLNVKLPKALKIKSPDYKVIAGAETEKEIEKDEPLTQNNVEQTEKNDENYEQSQEAEEICDDSLNADETQSGDTNADSKESECREEESTRDGEVYSCRALMNDVVKELIDRLANLEQVASEEESNEVYTDDDETIVNTDEESTLVNDTTSSVFDDLTSLEYDSSLEGPLKEEEEENCKELTHVDEFSTALEGGKEGTSQSSISENIREQPDENDEQKTTLQLEIIIESKERKEVKESKEMEKISCEIDGEVLDHPSQDEETNQPESEPKQSEDILQQPEDLPQGPEIELKQPEDEPKQPDNILETEEPEHVAEQNTDLLQTSEVSSDESEKELVRQEKSEVQKHQAGETEKDKSGDGFPKVQNVQEECQSPEDVVQSESEQRAFQTMTLNGNQNNKQPLTRDEGENTKEISVILSLLHHFEPGNPSEGYSDIVYKLVMQTADQTYSTLVNLVSAFLTRAGQIPKKVLVSVLIHLIKKYPQCFKIKKIKRKAVLTDDQVTAYDTVM